MPGIIDVDIEQKVKKSFMEYAVAVLISRALPDVRDGLKPVHRRILYSMYGSGLTPDKAYLKSVTAVGDVLGKYHPHGDASVYDAMVRMAQDFSMRYVLIDGHGNFGSVDGDPPAAYRYTEARMDKLALEMLRDIDKETVDFMPNFDGRLKEPVVLPSRFPNLLVNGSSGIAVGMATNIPSHNLREVIDGALCLLRNPEATLEELMKFIPGPDFPTGGIIMGHAGIRAAYATGRGKIKVRSRAVIEEEQSGKSRIVVSEIPYKVNKSKLCESIGELVKDKRIEGITAIRDETSSRAGTRIVIEVSKSANANVVLNQLYQLTQMQDNFSVNMLALTADNTPKIMTLREVLTYYVAHQKDVVVRRTKFDLRKALERAHILEGLRIAVDNIEEVIRIIRHSASVPEAKQRLMERFSGEDVSNMLKRSGAYEENDDNARGLTDEQATAIVSMTLGQLTGLGLDKIEKEFADKMATVTECRAILSSDERVKSIIEGEMTDIRNRFGDDRRTEIAAVDNDIDIEDLIKEETCLYTLTSLGYIKRLPEDAYRAQKRGGKGVTGMNVREEDATASLFVCSTHENILFFTTSGRVFRLKGYNIPEAGRTAKGMNIINLLQLDEDEKVTTMLHITEAEEEADERRLVLVTRKGTVKRLNVNELRSIRKAGLRALTLDEGDSLASAFITSGEDDILVGTRSGLAVRFAEDEARVMGRTAVGVRAIRLAEGDEVVGAAAISGGALVLTVTENGFGKLTSESEFPAHHRGGSGIKLHEVNDKTGRVAGMLVTDAAGDILLVTDQGMVIRTQENSLRTCGRGSMGVIVMRPAEGEKISAIVRADSAEAEPEAAPESEDGE